MSVTSHRDLRPTFGTVREQGPRPTCCAFACSDLHAAVRATREPLSREYAHFHGKRRDGTGPDEGVYLRTMLEVLRHDGQPDETRWPYSLTPIGDPASWGPPADVGTLYRAVGARTAADEVAAVRACIDQGWPVVMVITVSDAFYGTVDADGVIDSNESPDPTRVHAVVAVGHGSRGGEAVTLVRNSWGLSWGLGGHAWLTDRYVRPRLLERATLTKVA